MQRAATPPTAIPIIAGVDRPPSSSEESLVLVTYSELLELVTVEEDSEGGV
jgi:hypothetical protein